MTYFLLCSVGVVLVAGFLASYLPGLGIGPLWFARVRLANASGFREHVAAMRKVACTALLMAVAGVLRLGTFGLGVATIYTESLIGRCNTDTIEQNENQGEIGNG